MRVLSTILGGLEILLGFYLMRYGVQAGLIERRIRTMKPPRREADGSAAVSWGIGYIFAGMILMGGAAYMLLWGLEE